MTRPLELSLRGGKQVCALSHFQRTVGGGWSPLPPVRAGHLHNKISLIRPTTAYGEPNVKL